MGAVSMFSPKVHNLFLRSSSPCQVWFDIAGACNDASPALSPLNLAGQYYPTSDFECNLQSYNIQAACSDCQGALYSNVRLTLAASHPGAEGLILHSFQS